VSEPEYGQSDMQYFSVNHELSLILACLCGTTLWNLGEEGKKRE
jgi:hypothetical protein